jgi:drug/metabolite transporter (DMT)-like permease
LHAERAAGVASALGAGLCWGLVFVAPVMLPDAHPVALSLGRYLAFGLIALVLAWPARIALAALSRADWHEALRLALVGNLVYYAFLASAIQAADVPLPTLIIGTLPVVIAVTANLTQRELAWKRLWPALVAIAGGILLVHASEASAGLSQAPVLGAVLALAAVVCWTWYPIRNARWLQTNPQHSAATWATAQGLATLPLALIGTLLAIGLSGVLPAGPADAVPPWGSQAALFLGLMTAIGLLASWLGTLLWNRASQRLPTALSGQLIVFETLAALAYGYLWRGQWPDLNAAGGIALLCLGVVLGVRSVRSNTGAPGPV